MIVENQHLSVEKSKRSTLTFNNCRDLSTIVSRKCHFNFIVQCVKKCKEKIDSGLQRAPVLLELRVFLAGEVTSSFPSFLRFLPDLVGRILARGRSSESDAQSSTAEEEEDADDDDDCASDSDEEEDEEEEELSYDCASDSDEEEDEEEELSYAIWAAAVTSAVVVVMALCLL